MIWTRRERVTVASIQQLHTIHNRVYLCHVYLHSQDQNDPSFPKPYQHTKDKDPVSLLTMPSLLQISASSHMKCISVLSSRAAPLSLASGATTRQAIATPSIASPQHRHPILTTSSPPTFTATRPPAPTALPSRPDLQSPHRAPYILLRGHSPTDKLRDYRATHHTARPPW